MRAVCFILFSLLGFISAEFCYNELHTKCNLPDAEAPNCNAKYSAAHQVFPDLQEYIMQHLSYSFQFLTMSANFDNYEKNREGFAKLFKKFSDKTWEDSIKLIKYLTKRGGKMQFDVALPREPNAIFTNNFNMHELESLSRALDMHKSLAVKAHTIHSEVTRRKTDYHDAETLSYLENEFAHEHSEIIREVAGYTNDLTNLLKIPDPSLSVYMFDEYLKKVA